MIQDKKIDYKDCIYVKGARVNNLKGVDVSIPLGSFTVITGLSGSGKSSLAFDTLYAEGQRRYVESLSAYARQFMGRMAKPEADAIKGLPPAIAIEQKVSSRTPRSTVGTSTEIYDYMRLLFGRVGHTFSPVSGVEVRKHTVEDVLAAAAQYPEGTRIALTAPIAPLPDGRALSTQLGVLAAAGYSRLLDTATASMVRIDDLQSRDDVDSLDAAAYELLIDRLAVAAEGSDEFSRLAEGVETAFREGNGRMTLLAWPDGSSEAPRRADFSNRFEADGMTFVEPSEHLFNFNNPIGACPRCEGFGRVLGIDERLVVPRPERSVYDDAVAPWRGEKMSQWKHQLITLSQKSGFPIHKPYRDLSPRQLDYLWHGDGGAWEGIDGFFRMVESQRHKIQYRVLMAHYQGKTLCPVCHGSRLRPEASYVRVGGRTISELCSMPVSDLARFFDSLELNDHDTHVAGRLLTEIRTRLQLMCDVGLGYLTLDRMSRTLSGGESQRIRLATSLGSSLVGSLYILDEPSIGLHPRDTARLISVLKRLQQLGNTVVVVEHDEEVMRAADYLIDVGPDAGRLGGEIVYQGPAEGIVKASGYTADYLSGRAAIAIPEQRRKWSSYIEVTGAREHNLKDITVRFPLGVMTVVTGVSGSGKSTLVRDILFKALNRRLGNPGDAPGNFESLGGDLHRISAVEFVDQNPIGKSTRSNPATYLKAYDEIRHLFADRQAAKQMGMTAAYFSFNTDGGRCDECKGEGKITIEMQFMADITITCEACHGMRFKPDVLEVKYMDRNISDVLDMTVDQAIDFFSIPPEDPADASTTRRIVQRLKPLQDVGLGYIKLGQSSSTLSGGENQRVKLAYYLAQEKSQPTMFIFDEPTTGLHFHDINTLLDSFRRLIDKGHTILIIEHNPDVIMAADHVIDIGPEGGDGGGTVVAVGTPEQIAACPESYTGRFLSKR